ncbi:O-linked N-acetylglucosamine transferase, SPINDLY family protein [Pantoea sp. GL120224-02]|uniref:O-linked N-acetylglucosamine transferase, SPINDLY family protein n=1 Tax=Pantoea sp. GL120224-02 TaxID=1378084 RepID=UPI000BCA638D|nr:hypothetical protein [Pantoea sp. GL120224-02]SNY55537.1 Predicted O-linked N-acetylglucosamine transferase, SPINDLY family [Pantoea sp. GL120224-02]
MKKTFSSQAVPTKTTTTEAKIKIHRAVDLLSEKPAEALILAKELLCHDKNNPLLWVISARAQERIGDFFQAEESLNKALHFMPDYDEALYAKANLLYRRERFAEAELFLQGAIVKLNKEASRPLRSLLATVLQKLKKYEPAIIAFQTLAEEDPDNWLYWNNLGMIYQDLADFDKMDLAYQRSCELTKTNAITFFNHIVGSHYNPQKTAEEILELCQNWQRYFSPPVNHRRRQAKNKSQNKTLRIGMISDGFRSHPVGNMITIGLSHLPEAHIDIYAYSTNFNEDHVTNSIQRICKKWQVIDGLTDATVEKIIEEDEIDILFDLCGYNANSRMQLFQKGVAPIQIKWVGGLISSTGIENMDYLLSDHVETPEGSDGLYTEKLIRLPGDYICYDPPYYLPALSEPPVIKNGFITFGCFNNASKINEPLLELWANLLNQVPNSRLFLKSFNFKNVTLRERTFSILESYGVERERVILEGSSPHRELLSSYNDVDIALDPWPYSGGLTTCEAMAMGVPVVTLPGPTFAGRHSASHLVHAGMAELVADSAQQYVNIAVGLTQDINSLSVIRQHLRDILLVSPVCDGKRFAQGFSDAMRAVWQHYCDGCTPAALSLFEGTLPQFAGSSQPIYLTHPEVNTNPVVSVQSGEFEFQLDGKVMLMDYGAVMTRSEKFLKLTATEALHCVIMDAIGEVKENHLPLNRKSLQHIKTHLLGDGEETPVYICLNERYSSDLKTLAYDNDSSEWVPQKVIAELKMPSSKLDNIHGLNRLEWFIADSRFNLRSVFNNGQKILQSTLLLAVRFSFESSHQGQIGFNELLSTLAEQGFTFHSLHNIEYGEPAVVEGIQALASSRMLAAQLLFMPNDARLTAITNAQREKLAFILHAGYELRDEASRVLTMTSTERARAYLSNHHDAASVQDVESPNKQPVSIIPEMPRMSVAETELFERYVKQSRRYFEFGSGGSTKLATRQGVQVYGVESDKFWVETLHKEAGSLCRVDYVDIGPTKEWGYPVNDSHQDKFPLYSEAIHQHVEAFDFILVDGRFRVACTLNAIKHALDSQEDESATLIFIHDFWSRRDYHSVLEFLDTVEKAEDAGVFRIKSGIDRVYMDLMLERFKLIPS